MKVKLEEVCYILDSQRIPITASDRSKGIYPYYGANGIQDYVDDYIFDDELVLLAEDGGNFGSTDKPIAYRVSGKCWVNNHAHVLKAKDCIDTDYLCYSLMFYNTDGLVNGATRQKLTQKAMRQMTIPLCNREKQQSIVATLKKVFLLIDCLNQLSCKLDELIKSRFVEMFGDPAINPYNWQSLKIQDAVAVKPQNGLYKPQSDYVEDNSGVPILRIDGFYNGKVVDYRNLKRLICTKEEFDKYQLVENDIVINRVNSLDYLGKCARISGLIEGTVYESNMMRMHFIDERFNPIYLTFLLCSEYTYDQIISHAKKAVNQASINQQDVLDFNIFEPPIDLQNQFADFVTQVEKQKATVQQSIDKLKTLKKSLMQEYFG